jgi:hypothetical protein
MNSIQRQIERHRQKVIKKEEETPKTDVFADVLGIVFGTGSIFVLYYILKGWII